MDIMRIIMDKLPFNPVKWFNYVNSGDYDT